MSIGKSINIIIAAPPEKNPGFLPKDAAVMRMGYRVSDSSELMVDREIAGAEAEAEGGTICVSGDSALKGEAEELAGDIAGEVEGKKLKAVVFETRCENKQRLQSAVEHISDALREKGVKFYLPEAYSEFSEYAGVIVGSSVFEGVLSLRLAEKIKIYGRERLCAHLEIGAALIRKGENRAEPIAQEKVWEILYRKKPEVLFSEELYKNYCTIRRRSRQTEGDLIFDTEKSLEAKLNLFGKLGIKTVFMGGREAELLFGEA